MGKRRAVTSRAKTPEEARLLRLARELAAIGRDTAEPARALNAALARLAAAAEVAGPRAARPPHKLGRLAYAWAREQTCLALAELIQRAARVGAARADVPAELLAWLLLAAAAALAHEPADAVGDRLQALREFLRLPRD
jgi:hypothetical protein